MDKEELKFLTVDASIVVIESCFPSTINTRAFTAFSSLGSLAVSQHNVMSCLRERNIRFQVMTIKYHLYSETSNTVNKCFSVLFESFLFPVSSHVSCVEIFQLYRRLSHNMIIDHHNVVCWLFFSYIFYTSVQFCGFMIAESQTMGFIWHSANTYLYNKNFFLLSHVSMYCTTLRHNLSRYNGIGSF